jgi:large subunit ribosomal protein L17
MAFAVLLAALAAASSGAQAFTHPAALSPPAVAVPVVGAGQRAPRMGQPAEGPSVTGLCLACGAAAVLAARGLVRGRTAMGFYKRKSGYGKKDYPAIFGPQYNGPKIDYIIMRGPRLGMPRNGEQRTIPKLSGGSFDKRKELMKYLTTAVIKNGRIKTTYARAMAVQSFVDRMVVLAKRGDDLSRREAEEWMIDSGLVDNLFKLAPERYGDKSKDFTQVTRTMAGGNGKGEKAYVELV